MSLLPFLVKLNFGEPRHVIPERFSSQGKKQLTLFSFCFHLSTLIRFRKTHTFLMRFCLSSTTKQPKTLMEATVQDAFFGTVFKSLCFHPFTLETDRFRNDTFSQGSTFETVLNAFSLVFRTRFLSF